MIKPRSARRDGPRPKPPSGRSPGPLPGGRAEIEIALDPDRREEAFRRLRPLVPLNRGRVTITPGAIVVEGLRPGEAEAVCRALDQFADDLARRPVRRRDLVA